MILFEWLTAKNCNHCYDASILDRNGCCVSKRSRQGLRNRTKLQRSVRVQNCLSVGEYPSRDSFSDRYLNASNADATTPEEATTPISLLSARGR